MQQIRDEAMTIFLAGHETTANAMAWTWHLLGQSPAVEAKLHDELARVLDGRTPAVEDVAKLEYTRAVVAESMRLYPPAWTMGRRAIETHTIAGHIIDPGALVIVSQWIVHHDPRWWDEPDDVPPRSMARASPAPGFLLPGARPKYAYFPFGGGSRICIGESFAWTEAILLLATIAQQWRFVAGRAPDARAADHAPTERSPYAGCAAIDRRYGAITCRPNRSISSSCGLHCSSSRSTPAASNSRTRSMTCFGRADQSGAQAAVRHRVVLERHALLELRVGDPLLVVVVAAPPTASRR